MVVMNGRTHPLLGLVQLVQVSDDLGNDEILRVAREQAQREHHVLAKIRANELLEHVALTRVGEVHRRRTQHTEPLANVRVALVTVYDQRVDPRDQVDEVKEAH